MNLPTKQKTVVLLRYYQRMKMQDIAQTLRVSLETVKYRLRKAENMLKDQLEGWYFDED